jgi:hypothetical protein
MTIIGNPPSGLVPIHIGLAEPGSAAAEPRPRHDRFAKTPLQERSPLTDAGIDWAMHGAEPRWLGQESWDCAVGLEPGIYHSAGNDERKRLIAGAVDRGETALLVSSIGDTDGETSHNVFAGSGADSVMLPELNGSIGGPRLPTGARPSLASDLDRCDRDLGLRLLNRPRDAAWWTLELTPLGMETYNGTAQTQVPDGHLHPILIDGSGRPVVAAWIPAGGNVRWYIVPDATDWNTVIDWLVHQALPTHVPGALRRVRHATFTDPDLQTERETQARQNLAELDEEYAQRKAELAEELRLAEESAAPVRDGLLYSTGDELAGAVARVLTDAGLAVVDLDRVLGATDSADLLVTGGTRRRLVEVKSAGGAASEKLVDSLRKHLETWPTIKPDLPVDGGTLIVNHQHKLAPQQRAATVYSHKVFTDSLTFPVISTRDLFEWWRTANWTAICDAVLGQLHLDAADDREGSQPEPPSPAAMPGRSRRRPWRATRRSTE